MSIRKKIKLKLEGDVKDAIDYVHFPNK